MKTIVAPAAAMSGHDQYLFREGTHTRLYERLGAHLEEDGAATRFAGWAPNAQSVAVIGDFNAWVPRAHPMQGSDSGVWQARVPAAKKGAVYKYHVVSRDGSMRQDKADPYALRTELAPRTGSVVWDLDYEWGDAEWMRTRRRANALDAPWSVYEVHLGSWRRAPEEPGRLLSFEETAVLLSEYCKRMGFTHVELMPIMEHPFYGS